MNRYFAGRDQHARASKTRNAIKVAYDPVGRKRMIDKTSLSLPFRDIVR